MKKIDLEAHFYTQEYVRALYEHQGYPNFRDDPETGKRRLWYTAAVGQPFADFLLDALTDLGAERIAKMDDFGIDMQALSLSAPGLEQLDAATGTSLCKNVNDALFKVIQTYPDRFLGYATLAPKNPKDAAAELERTVKDFGFMGWNTHSNFGDSHLDSKAYWPILEMAAKLKVPVYLHPTVPTIPYEWTYGFALAGTPFGFGFDTVLCMIRLIYSGVFDRYPDLQIILGHLGEALPFLYKRIDWAYVRPFDPEARAKLERKPSEYLKDNVFVTTSGNHYTPAFMCTYEALGIDRILLGTDYPYEDTRECLQFLEQLPISHAEKEKVYYGNAKQLGII